MNTVEIKFAYATSPIATALKEKNGCYYYENDNFRAVIGSDRVALKKWVNNPANATYLYKANNSSLRFVVQQLAAIS